MIVIGLTGSIGMGKSSAGAMLEYLGVPVHDSDKSVHALFYWDSPAWKDLKAAFPYHKYPQIYRERWAWALWKNSFSPWWRYIDRKALGKIVFSDEAERLKLEAITHPFVQQKQREFIHAQRQAGKRMVALDIPLLFETGAQNRVDYTVCVTAPAHVQKQRVLARPGMSEEKFHAILARQMPDAEKRARSDYIVHSGLGRAHMMKDVRGVLADITARSRQKRAG